MSVRIDAEFEYGGVVYHRGDKIRLSYKLHHEDSQALHLESVYFINHETTRRRIGVSALNPEEVNGVSPCDRKSLRLKTIYISEDNIETILMLPQKPVQK